MSTEVGGLAGKYGGLFVRFELCVCVCVCVCAQQCVVGTAPLPFHPAASL